jgi:hypothetical protein
VHQHQRLIAAAAAADDDDPVRFINIGVVHDFYLFDVVCFFFLCFFFLPIFNICEGKGKKGVEGRQKEI